MRKMVINIKCRGNTLPEILIAIVIITFTSALGLVIFLNIQKNTQPFIKLKANELALSYLKKTCSGHEFFDDISREGDFVIKRTILPAYQYPPGILISIQVSGAQEKKIIEIHKMVYDD